MKTIQELMTNFRVIFNNDVKSLKNKILKDSNKWFQICSAMDCVEDTQLAIDYFVKSEFPEAEGENFIFNYGGQYIFIYGLLQALFLQQNALMDIAEVLNFGLNFEKNGIYPELYEIREIRNKVVGHPTKRKYGKEWRSTHSIVRTSMTKESFEIRSKYKEQKESEFEEINTLKYISVQEEKVKEIINNLVVSI